MRIERARTILVVLTLAVLGRAAEASAQEPRVELDPLLPFATRRVIDLALDAPHVRTGESAVLAGDSVTGALTQVGGSLLIEGTVSGDVTALDAAVTLRPSARIAGRLVVLAGRLYGTSMATVDQVVWLREEPLRVIPQPGGGFRVEYLPPPKQFPIALQGIFGLVPYEYNRVDGLAFGLRAGLRKLENQPRTELAFGPVLRTARFDDVGWDVSGLREFPSLGITAGGGVYSITDTPERWLRSDVVNSLAGFLFADDFRTYHEREGYELWVERALIRWPLTLRARWRDDAFDSLPSEDPFAVFDDDWFTNPPAQPGEGRALAGLLRWDRRDDPSFPSRGLYAALEVETWRFGDDFDFDRAWGEVRGYVPLGAGGSFASLRAIAAGRLGDGDTLAPQFLYRLGGARSLPGYDELDPRLTGDRMALANLRLHLRVPFSNRVFERMYLVGMGDVGDAWFAGAGGSWNAAAGGGLAGRGQTAYVGVFGAYGFESEEWKVYLLLGPWF